jgi:hypothetical protein
MDLNLYFRVLWRFRILALIGLALATLLAVLTLVKISFSDGLQVSYRGSERWSSTASIFVTQEGFPLGRSIYDEVVPVGSGGTTEGSTQATAPDGEYVPRFADPSRFSTYAQLYARLASSDLLERRMLRDGPLNGQVTAETATDPRNPGIFLPLVDIQGLADTASAARATAARATRALVEYVKQEQVSNEIAPSRRVILRVLNEPGTPVLVVARSKTRPVFVFGAVLIAFAALLFLLENLRPQARDVPIDEQEDVGLRADSRRSA